MYCICTLVCLSGNIIYMHWKWQIWFNSDTQISAWTNIRQGNTVEKKKKNNEKNHLDRKCYSLAKDTIEKNARKLHW